MMMMQNKIRPLLLWLTLSSPVLADDAKSGLFVPSDDLCPPMFAQCAEGAPCYDHSIGICDASTGEMDVTGENAGCAQALQSCGGCFPHSKCGDGASTEPVADEPAATDEPDDAKSGLFVPSDDLCPAMLAACAEGAPCYDHSIGICDASTGEMDVTGENAGCAEALQSCGGCFPHSKCGDLASTEPAADETLDVSPGALAHLGAAHTCLGDDDTRCFYTYVPECAGADAPLVFDIHGFGSSPQYSSFYTGWAAKATENCFVVAFPLGHIDPADPSVSCWQFPGGLEDADGNVADPCCCNPDIPSPEDDTAFLRDAVAHVVQSLPGQTDDRVTIDAKRIYMAGHSNGCMAAITMAALHSDVVAAVGCHAGTALAPFPDSYAPRPMMMIHGDADSEVPFGGGNADGVTFFGAPTVHALVAAANGCAGDEEVRTMAANNYTTYSASSCEDGAEVVLLALEDVGHEPYLGFKEVAGFLDGAPTKVDTTQLAWEFVSKHSLAVAPDLSTSGEIDDEEEIDDEDTNSTMAAPIPNPSPTATPVASDESESPPSSASLFGSVVFNIMLFPPILIPVFLFL